MSLQRIMEEDLSKGINTNILNCSAKIYIVKKNERVFLTVNSLFFIFILFGRCKYNIYILSLILIGKILNGLVVKNFV